MRALDIDRETADVPLRGSRMRYLRRGSGPPLILIHGLVGSHRNWRYNMDALARVSTVYAVDLLNMGDSGRIASLDPTLEASADCIVAFMDALGLAQADIAGHSHGGAIALALAIRHPGRTRRLVLFAPANPFCRVGAQLIRFYQNPAGRFLAHMIPAFPRWTKMVALRRMYGDPARVPPDALGGYIEGLAVPGTIDHVLAILRVWEADMARLRLALPALAKVPALLLWGDRDRAVGLSSAKQLQSFFVRSRLEVIPGAGHIPFEEMPAACNRAMLEFLRSPVSSLIENESPHPLAHTADVAPAYSVSSVA